MSRKQVNITEDQIKEAIAATPSAKAASEFIGVKYSTYIRRAKAYGLHVTNQGLKGTKREEPSKLLIALKDILQKGTTYKTATLKARLLKEGIKSNECEECGQGPTWFGRPLVMHLDHVDGDNTNNELRNLRILCPNCHTQTSTYCRGFRHRAGVAK